MKQMILVSLFVMWYGVAVAMMPEAPECPICMQPVDLTLPADNSEVALTTTPLFGCKHPDYFHASCLARILQISGAQSKCPLCRSTLLAQPGPNLPATIQAAWPEAHAQLAAPAPVQAAQVPDVPEHVTDISQIMHRYNAVMNTLDLSHRNIIAIDGIVFEQINKQLQNLRYLNLAHTQIAVLPPEIGQLQNLQYLHLRNTQIAALPPEIGQLQNLQHLYLGNTSIVGNANWPALREQLLKQNPQLRINDSINE